MALKDQFNENSNARTFTLDQDDVQMLAHLNQFMQSILNTVQEHVAATFLNHKAVTQFGYERGKDLRFNFDPSKEVDNLTITEITEA